MNAPAIALSPQAAAAAEFADLCMRAKLVRRRPTLRFALARNANHRNRQVTWLVFSL